MTVIDEALELHRLLYGNEPDAIVKTPGRVNIIGEHTDYNGGLVFPFCINQALYISVSVNNRQIHRLHTQVLNESAEINLNEEDHNEHWVKCFIGALKELRLSGTGYDVCISGDLPYGKGLSSSSALCCGYIKALAASIEKSLSNMEIAQLAYNVEHNFIGIPCGFMDQFVICHGEKDKATLLDCGTLDYEFSTLPMDCRFVLFDSGVRRSLHNSEYSNRKASCDRVLKTAKAKGFAVSNVSELTEANLDALNSGLDDSDIEKVRYILEENRRVRRASGMDKATALGQILNEGQAGLRDKYKVSCKEIDLLTEKLNETKGVYGARMVGGGFGGCVLALIHPLHDVQSFKPMMQWYKEKTGCTATILEVKPSSGIEMLTN